MSGKPMLGERVQMADQTWKRLSFQIRGMEKVNSADLEIELTDGARFVVYEYCISLIAVSLRRLSAVYLVRTRGQRFLRGMPYALLSLCLGWWGVPWGIIYTPLALATNLTGGCDVTAQVRSLLLEPHEEST
jgi:hypothetical protein